MYLIKKDLRKIVKGLPKNKSEDDWLLSGLGNDKERFQMAAKMIQAKALYSKKSPVFYICQKA